MRVACLLFAIAIAADVSGQNPIGEPRFDVVSIKRAEAGASSMSVGYREDGTWRMTNGPVWSLLSAAFRLKNPDIIGLPDWATSERYDVIATGSRPSAEQEQRMLRGLLADRFNFRGHTEPREIPVFAMVVARSDRPLPPGLVRLQTDCAAVREARRQGEAVTPLPDGSPPCGYSMKGGAELVLTSTGITMELLADAVSNAAGRVVIDRTELTGFYAFTLTYDLPRTNGGAADTPTIVTALPEQLGLKLEPTRAPVNTLVIDHIERPTEN